ncbi:MAG: hypothetical protein J3R72DRAFT_435350 [Linnemannia gamsii]|nr:MAG: hypothetical protein J3R72DRAFT_435350 [Linnemannia gamsii]
MITHQSKGIPRIRQDGAVWLQVTRTGSPCCRSFGRNSYRFEDYINRNNNWHIFYMGYNMGKVHYFHNFWMIHGSRLGGVNMPYIWFNNHFSSLHALQNPYIQCASPYSYQFYGRPVYNPMSFMMNPVGFLESLCGWSGHHIHVQLFLPTY